MFAKVLTMIDKTFAKIAMRLPLCSATYLARLFQESLVSTPCQMTIGLPLSLRASNL